MSVRSLFVMAVPAAVVAAVAVAAGAHATTAAPQAVALSGSTAAASPAVADESWSHLCGRVDKALAKVTAADTRLRAGADTKGSSARLQARLDAAAAVGDADRVRVLTDLVAMRSAHAQTVAVRLAKLGDIRQVCAGHPR